MTRNRSRKYLFGFKNGLLFGLLMMFWVCGFVSAAEIFRVAVASNFKQVAIPLAQEFSSENRVKVEVVSGSTGKLFVQIRQGAPFDVFLSADKKTIEKMLTDNLAVEHSDRTYAIGQLLLWRKSCRQPFSLINFNIDENAKIAIANPRLAPYGAAAQEFLVKRDLWQKLGSRFVYAENISQVAQMAKLGVVDMAFVAESQKSSLQSEQMACFVHLPLTSYSPIEQQLAIVKRSKHRPLARAFVKFMGSARAQALIKNRGYLLPKSGKIDPL